jgi:hypothetical protein
MEMILLKISYLVIYLGQRCKDRTNHNFAGPRAGIQHIYNPPMISTRMNPRFKKMEPNRFIRIELA